MIINKLKAFKKSIEYYYLPALFSRSRFLANLYYTIFSSEFSREHQAVLLAKVKHIKDVKRTKTNYFLLVRNTHRIEKGLLMRPRKDVFAKEYIEETIDCFVEIWKHNPAEDKDQLQWFHDVLSLYFYTSGTDGIIKKAKQLFFKTVENNRRDFNPDSQKFTPYRRLLGEKPSFLYDDFYRLVRQRKSVRWFLKNPVPRDIIDRAILAAIQAPSACNRQPFEFRVFDDPLMVDKLVHVPMGTSGYAHSIPVMVIVVGNLEAYYEERDRHLIYIDGALASMSFMLALETMGASSCPINWPDIERREKLMDKLLGLEKSQRAIMCIGVGFPDPMGMVAFSQKRNLNQIRKFN